MNKIYSILALALLFLFSCTRNRAITSSDFSDEVIATVEEEKVILPLTKLNALLLLPPDSLIKHVDLSNDSLSFFPDLSNRRIKSLDLSHNQIDTFMIAFLPQGIERLNLSFNSLRSFNTIPFERIPPWTMEIRDTEGRLSALTELNLSNNNLTGRFVSTQAPIRRLDISHNDLTGVSFTYRITSDDDNDQVWRVNYFNIAHNPRLSSVLDVYSIVVDTLIRHNIADSNWITLVPPPPPPPDMQFGPDLIIEVIRLDEVGTPVGGEER